MRCLVIIVVLVAQILGMVLAEDYPQSPMLGDAPGDGAYDGDYYDGPGPGLAAMMPQLNPAAALESLLFNADPSLLLSIPSPPPTSTPLLCRMFPNTVRCLQYRLPFTGENIAPRVDAAPEPAPEPLAPTPEDGPEEQQPQMQQQMQQQAPNYPPPLSYQYVLLGVPSTAAVHPVVAPYEPCRVGFDEQQQQQVYDQQTQQQQLPQIPQQPVNPCPGAQKLPQAASTQNVVVAQQARVEKTPAAKAPEVVQVTPAQSSA